MKGRVNWENAKFIVFTSASVSPTFDLHALITIAFCGVCSKLEEKCVCSLTDVKQVKVFARPLSTRRFKVLDTSDDTQGCYVFLSSDKRYVLPKVYFYTSQRKRRYFPASIDELFSKTFKEAHVQISRELIEHVENWNGANRGNPTHKLTKEDVLIRLGGAFLEKFTVTPKDRPRDGRTNEYEAWIRAVNAVHVTVLRASTDLDEMCEPFNLLMEDQLELRIDVRRGAVNFSASDIQRIRNSVLRDYVAEEAQRDVAGNSDDDKLVIAAEKLYPIFWKVGLIPLLLQVPARDQEYVLQTIEKLNDLGLTRRYFLKTCGAHIKSLVDDYKNLSFFVSSDDVLSKLPLALIDQVKISVSNSLTFSLKTIKETDDRFERSILANDFFDMVLGKYSFRPATAYRVTELKLVLNEERMNTLREEMEAKIEYGRASRPQTGTKPCFQGIDSNLFA